jgi:outer membrane protein TolC
MWHSVWQHFPVIRSRIRVAGAAGVLAASAVFAQQPNSSALTISAAVQTALQRYPSIPAAEEQVNAAAAGIRLARTNYLPSLNALGQVNRATRNNVFGLLLPQAVIPNMSGPVLGTNNGANVWGSAVGVLVSWEPFDFGRRHALIESARATRNRADLAGKRTQFDIETATAAAFLTLLASEQTVRAAQAAVDRSQVLVRSVTALVNAQLRPGADLSRANTELDAAETQLIQAEQSVDVARTAVARYTGLDSKSIHAVSGRLLQLPSETKLSPAGVEANPAAQEQKAMLEESQARLRVLEHTYRPTFNLQAGAYARGTGALPDGSTLGGGNGLAPNYFNAGIGFNVSFPAFSLFSIRAQEAQEAAAGRSASATYRQVLTDLQAQLNAAQATLAQAQRIAAVTPKEVADARAGFDQANAQYRSGLTTIVAVAETQRLLAQAEIDDSLAKLAVWRAMLQIQTVQGDISGFLSAASK